MSRNHEISEANVSCNISFVKMTEFYRYLTKCDIEFCGYISPFDHIDPYDNGSSLRLTRVVYMLVHTNLIHTWNNIVAYHKYDIHVKAYFYFLHKINNWIEQLMLIVVFVYQHILTWWRWLCNGVSGSYRSFLRCKKPS